MDSPVYNYIATSTFGLEAAVKREVARLGCASMRVSDGRIDFSGGLSLIPRANIRLRVADRVLLNMGEFDAFTFDELFEGTKALPWDDFITEDAKFTVTGKSVRSRLFSISDCQSIVKKAVVEKLKLRYHRDWFDETGPEYKIQVGVLKDHVTLTIDTTGAGGLHKRGYREIAGTAPLKETLAAAMIEMSFWRKDRILLDPVCGSGTIPIEAAMIARNIAPGLRRSFVSETWPQIDPKLWREERAAAYCEIDASVVPEIYGSDIDPYVIELAKSNAEKAGVDDCIHFTAAAARDARLPGAYGVAVCNPPYGARIGQTEEIIELYHDFRELFSDPTWSVYILTADEDIEKILERKANAKRKLFNGMIKTDYYQFIGPKPPSTPSAQARQS